MALTIDPADLPLAPLMRADATGNEKVVWYACGALYRFAEEQGWDISAPALELLGDDSWALVAARIGVATITPGQIAAVIGALADEQAEQARLDDLQAASR